MQFKDCFWKYKVLLSWFKVKGENCDFISAIGAGFAFFFYVQFRPGIHLGVRGPVF
jgi:hypothetical protein